MNLILSLSLFLLFSNNVYSFKNKLFLPNFDLKLNMKPHDMITYLTTFRDYTIVTIGNDYKNLEELMTNNKMNVYYADLNNLMDSYDILDYLRKKYNNFDTAQDLWIFHKGFFIGSSDDIIHLINKKNK